MDPRRETEPSLATRCPGIRIEPDAGRVLARPFLPGGPPTPSGATRIEAEVARILALSEEDAARSLREVRAEFGSRHRALDDVLDAHAATVARAVALPDAMSRTRRRLIGAYFTQEYAIEAAALSNPSMVAAPDQRGLAEGETRFVLSLRAIGEGHVSCIEFRTGVVGADLRITLDAPGPFAVTGVRADAAFDTARFLRRVVELGAPRTIAAAVLAGVGEQFAPAELETAICDFDHGDIDPLLFADTAHLLRWLSTSGYRLSFAATPDISERVIFPGGAAESRGMEDLRLVRFVEDDGRVVYYGTYTAFDGSQILPQLIETPDFSSFRVSTLDGAAASNKGIALFPRRVGGRYLALGRHDNVNNFLMSSDDVRSWSEAALIQEPKRPWEITQLGNCGSPLETEAGWLVITHGVGPMRRYSLGALLLDLDDPSRVIGHLQEPLLSPSAEEREGYVPNVVYSCGSMRHGDHVVLPYGVADVGARMATVPLAELLTRLGA